MRAYSIFFCVNLVAVSLDLSLQFICFYYSSLKIYRKALLVIPNKQYLVEHGSSVDHGNCFLDCNISNNVSYFLGFMRFRKDD